MNEDEKLRKTMQELIAQQKKLASLKWTFLRGIVYGLGVFIGSIVLVAFGLWILSLFDTAPIIGDFVSRVIENIEQQTGN